MTQKSIGGRIWDLGARAFIFLAGIIFLAFGLGGLIDGDIIPAAGRRGRILTTPTGAVAHFSGFEAHLYGAMFVLLGLYLIELGLGFRMSRWLKKQIKRTK